MTSKPNIVWITLDSVRQDHTTMGRYHRETTPNIQAIADEPDGTAFSSCFAHGHASATSVPSILSGMYPSRHGTYYEEGTAFPSDLPVVSELLNDAGYKTLAVSNNSYASSMTGLDRGFDDFTLLGATPVEIIRGAGIKNLIKYLLNIRKHSVGFNTDLHAHSGAYLVNQLVKSKLRDSVEPFFLYVHYMEPHRAYYPPLAYLNQFTEDLSMKPEEAASIAMNVHHNLIEIVANGCNLTDEEMAALKSMYDAEIAYTDEQVGEIYELIQESFDDTIVVVTADHGELFGEDEMLAHKYSLHNAVLNVPMVVKGIANLEDEGLVQHSDLTRTMLELAGAETKTIQGVDLRKNSREYAISQSPFESIDPLLTHNPEYDTSKFPPKSYNVIQDENFKYMQYPEETELYALPDERKNVSDAFPETVTEMDEAVTEWYRTEGKPVSTGSDVEVDEAMRKRLADLGYLDHEV